MRSKGSESGKHCTHARGSHVASGVKNGKVAPPFAEGEILSYIGFITTGPQVAFLRADIALWLPTFQAFRAHVLFSVIVNCEPHVSVILYYNSASGCTVQYMVLYNANAGCAAKCIGYKNNTYSPLENRSGKCRNCSDSNAVPRSWMLLPPFSQLISSWRAIHVVFIY